MTGIAPSRDKVIDVRQAVEALQGAVLDGRQEVMSSESKLASSEQGVTSAEQGVMSAKKKSSKEAEQLDNERGVKSDSAKKHEEDSEQVSQEDDDEAKKVRSAKQKVTSSGEEQTGPQQAQGDVVGSAGGESRGEKRIGYSETREEWLEAGNQRAASDYKKADEENELEEAGNVRHDMGVKSQGGQAGEVAEGGYEKGGKQGVKKEHDGAWVDAGNRRAREDYEPNGKEENESEEAGNVRHDMGDRSGEGQAGEVAEGGYQQGRKQGGGKEQEAGKGGVYEKVSEDVKRHPGSGVGELLRMDEPGKSGPSDGGSGQQGPSDERSGSGEGSQPQELKKTLEAQLAGGAKPTDETLKESVESTDGKAQEPVQVAPSMAGEIAQEPSDALKDNGKSGDAQPHPADDVSDESWRKTERMMDETWGSSGGTLPRE